MKTKFPKDGRRPEALTVEKLKKARGCDECLILRVLLAESLKRLRAGRGVEKDHGVVHPEVTCIVRDCERLARRLNESADGDKASKHKKDSHDAEMDRDIETVMGMQ